MYDRLLRHPFMSAGGVSALRCDQVIRAMLTVEFALAAEQESLGLLPEGTARELESNLTANDFDAARIAREAADGGNAAIPFVKQARATLPEFLKARFHKGATSQDIVDSALMLLLKPRLESCRTLLDDGLQGACGLMRVHRDTPMIGRTLMQQALPITFGAKVAGWAWGLQQAGQGLRRVAKHGVYLQFGGAVGVHSGFGDQGLALMDGMARRLGLNAPVLPWHTDRQPILALAAALGATAAAADKIALDVSLLAQTEFGEVSEPPETGAGGSSSMPHKRNPVGCARIRAAARQIHGLTGILANVSAQPLERGLGEWHAEWAPLLDSVLLLEGALETLAKLLAGLQVHEDAMQRNLVLTGGAIMAAAAANALAGALGSERAGELARSAAETARSQQRDYADVLLDDAAVRDAVGAKRLREAVDPALYIGSSGAQVDRVLSLLEEK